MNTTSEFDRAAAAWLADGPTELADRVLDAALREIHVTRQRRHPLSPWRAGAWTRAIPSAAMAGAFVVATVLVLALLRPAGFGGPDPTATPVPTPRQTPSNTVSPSPASAAATPRIPGSTIARDGIPLSPGVRYVLADFEPAFSFTGSGITFGIDEQGFAWFEHQTSPSAVIGVVHPRAAFAEGGATEPVPSDIVAWLQERSDLVTSSETPVSLGAVEGTLLEGTVPTDAFRNAGGAINVLCPRATGCSFESGGSLGYGPGHHVLILVTTVDGVPVTAMASASEADWPAIGADLDAFLRSFEFPA